MSTQSTFGSSHSSTYPFSRQESVQAGDAVDSGKPEDWMNSQVSPWHAKAYSGPYKFISGARIGRKVHTFVKRFYDFIFPAPPPLQRKGGGGAIHIISETEKILYFRTWSSYMQSIDTDPKLYSLFSERKISVRNQGGI